MINFILACTLLTLTNPVLAEGKSSHHGHTSGLTSHEHGAVKLDIAVTGKIIEVDLDGSSESFIGFEYTPSSVKEKKIFKDAQSLWINDLLTKLFVTAPNLGCTSSAVSFSQKIDEVKSRDKKMHSGIHSEIEAKAIISCNHDLAGKSVFISIKKHYPRINKLSIDILGSETKSILARTTEEIKL